jgi:hypothetical protein
MANNILITGPLILGVNLSPMVNQKQKSLAYQKISKAFVLGAGLEPAYLLTAGRQAGLPT